MWARFSLSLLGPLIQIDSSSSIFLLTIFRYSLTCVDDFLHLYSILIQQWNQDPLSSFDGLTISEILWSLELTKVPTVVGCAFSKPLVENHELRTPVLKGDDIACYPSTPGTCGNAWWYFWLSWLMGRVGMWLASNGVESRDAVVHPTIHRIALHNKDLASPQYQ